MKVLVLYRPVSEFARATEMFIRDFQHQHEDYATLLEVVDVDSREGVALASVYDVMQYPAVLVLAENGSVVKDWQGNSLPLMNELAGYLHG